MNLGDVCKINTKKITKDIDLITYGFPCQDISLSGQQRGMFNTDGSLTRSGLFFEALRIIKVLKPKIAIAENVKALTGKKFRNQFGIVLNSLENAGYNNYWQVLNAKDYGVPQNRERVFIISIRKDVDKKNFVFPEPFKLNLKLSDMLEEVVGDKYYLKQQHLKNVETIINKKIFNSNRIGGRGSIDQHSCDNVARCMQIADLHYYKNDQMNRVYSSDGVSPTILSVSSGSGREVKIVATAQRGRYEKDGKVQQRIEVSDREYANALTTVQKDLMVGIITEAASPSLDDNYRIRKLTPRECWRLMGFNDYEFDKAVAVCSNTQLYKQAGNSIVVNVLEEIYKELFKAIKIT